MSLHFIQLFDTPSNLTQKIDQNMKVLLANLEIGQTPCPQLSDYTTDQT